MESKDVSTKRLETIKNAMILEHLTDIDFNSKEERSLAYETLLSKTVIEGAFDDIFISDELEGLDKSERQKVLDLSRKYNSLCFYHGDIDYWLDSAEGITLGDEDTTAEILLRNYNYLIRLAKNGGEDVLRFLNKFRSNDDFNKGSVIALLINSFWGDVDSLETILIEMSKEDGKYKDFTDTQKIMMCESPDGLLIRKNEDGSIEFISSSELKKTICNEYSGEDDCLVKDIDSKNFGEIICKINSECLKGTVYKK